MIILTGEALKNFISERKAEGLKRRFIYNQLIKYLENDSDPRVFCLYGLRRTGKTIMMAQSVIDIDNFNNCAYFICQPDDTMMMLRREIDSLDVHYIFIDEITKIRDFINTCSYLADLYTFSGKRVVMAGTHSLGFMIARNDELLGRAHMLHTTYISYNEYSYLLNKGLEEYIKYGGLLTNDEDNENYNNDSDIMEYTDGAIVDNLMHSLENWDYGRRMGRLQRAYDAGILPSSIKKVIDRTNRDFLLSTINNKFFAYELHSLKDLLAKHNVYDMNQMDINDLIDKLRIRLGIKETYNYDVDQETKDEIIKYLIAMDVLYKIPHSEEYIFIQPGLRYYQTRVLADTLLEDSDFKILSESDKRAVLEKLDSGIKGKILEDILIIDMSKGQYNDGRYEVIPYRDFLGREFDITISDYDRRESVVIEVKHSTQMVKEQTLHLNDQNFCEEFETEKGTRIIKKAVIYRGENRLNLEIPYFNIEYFLTHSGDIKKILFNSESAELYPGGDSRLSRINRKSIKGQINNLKEALGNPEDKGNEKGIKNNMDSLKE